MGKFDLRELSAVDKARIEERYRQWQQGIGTLKLTNVAVPADVVYQVLWHLMLSEDGKISQVQLAAALDQYMNLE